MTDDTDTATVDLTRNEARVVIAALADEEMTAECASRTCRTTSRRSSTSTSTAASRRARRRPATIRGGSTTTPSSAATIPTTPRASNPPALRPTP